MIIILDDESSTPILDKLDILDLRINQGKLVTEFPVEDGTVRSDHVVLRQLVIEMTVAYSGGPDAMEAYSELLNLFEENKKVSIQSRGTTHRDMILSNIPRIEPADMIDGMLFNLQFKQWKDVKAREGTYTVTEVAVPQQSDTVKTGVKSGGGLSKKVAERQNMANKDSGIEYISQGGLSGAVAGTGKSHQHASAMGMRTVR